LVVARKHLNFLPALSTHYSLCLPGHRCIEEDSNHTDQVLEEVGNHVRCWRSEGSHRMIGAATSPSDRRISDCKAREAEGNRWSYDITKSECCYRILQRWAYRLHADRPSSASSHRDASVGKSTTQRAYALCPVDDCERATIARSSRRGPFDSHPCMA
jgi:hypothetical protein